MLAETCFSNGRPQRRAGLFNTVIDLFRDLFRARDASCRVKDDLTRIARTSLHLLADLGFEEDGSRVSPEFRQWRKDDIIISLDRKTGQITVDVGQAADVIGGTRARSVTR